MNDGVSTSAAKSRYPIICPHCNGKIESELTLRIVGPKLLIVEGDDEQGFFSAFLKNLNMTDIQIAPVGGKTKIREGLKAIRRDSHFSAVTSIGIIRDGDTDPQAAFQSVRDALTAADLPRPNRVLSFIKGPPRVGIMILPSMKHKGALEDLCLQAIVDDPATGCVEQFFKCLKQQGLPPSKELSKAKVQAFLSSREICTLHLGIAAQKGYWPLNHEAFESVRTFLHSL